MRNEWRERLAADVRIGVVTEGRPITSYVVRLEVLISAGWQVVHLFDNAHGQHDEHVYVGSAKQAARAFFEGPVTAALPAAIALLHERSAAIIGRWKNPEP